MIKPFLNFLKNLVPSRQTGRVILTGFFIVQLLFGYMGAMQVNTAHAQLIPNALNSNTNSSPADIKVPVYSGVEDSIKNFLCVPDDNNLGTALFDCISKVYRFGIAFGGIALVFFIVFAGYLYIAGGEASKGKGKTIFTTALTGMAIILSSYVLLRFINPNLVIIKPIQTPIFQAGDLPRCEDVGFQGNCVLPSGNVQITSNGGNGAAYGGRGCKPITNNNSPASIDNLSKTCWGKFGAQVVKNASIVAANETGGRPIDVFAGSCGAGKKPARCSGGEIPVFGVFQINIAAHPIPDGKGNLLDCPSAFTRGSASFCSNGCQVKADKKDLYNQCYQALKNLNNEFEVACRLYKANLGNPRGKTGKGLGFDDWGNTANEHGNKCGF